MPSKKVCFECIFAFLLVVAIDSLFQIQILIFSFPFLIQINFYWFQEGLQGKMTSTWLVIIACFVYLGQGPPWLLTEVPVEVTTFHHSLTTGGLLLL